MDLAVEGRALLVVVEVLRDLRDAEAAQRDAHQADPFGKKRQVERVARHAAVHVGADLPEQHADQAHRQAVQQAARSDEAHAHEADEHERAVVGGAEEERHFTEARREA